MRYTSPAAAPFLPLVAVALLAASQSAFAGTTLVSRDSGLRAAGASAAGEYNLSNGSGDFDVFADAVRSGDDSAAARSAAEQNSAPRLDAAGGFAGASADGSAHATVDPAAADAFSSAESDFDLVFQITGSQTRVVLDCALSAAGDGTAGIKLYNADTLEPAFADEVSGDSHSGREEKALGPGTYGISVWAFVRGTPESSTASYNVNLSVAANAPPPGPVPVPLPPAAWGGLGTFLLALGASVRARRRGVAHVE